MNKSCILNIKCNNILVSLFLKCKKSYHCTSSINGCYNSYTFIYTKCRTIIKTILSATKYANMETICPIRIQLHRSMLLNVQILFRCEPNINKYFNWWLSMEKYIQWDCMFRFMSDDTEIQSIFVYYVHSAAIKTSCLKDILAQFMYLFERCHLKSTFAITAGVVA